MDVVKCWPFDGDGDGDGDGSVLLPPMEVRKFRWWSHEVELRRSAAAQEKSSYAQQVESRKPDKSTDDRRQIKAKSRPPKKRSILEIFAVAPQIDSSADLEGGDDDDDADEAQVEGENGCVSGTKEDEFDSANGVDLKINRKNNKTKNKKKKKSKKKSKKKKKSRLEEEVAVGIESKVNKNKFKRKAKNYEESIASKVCMIRTIK